VARLVFVSFIAAALCCLAQERKALSEAEIISLHKAGLSDQVILNQIQQDGLSFHSDASTTIRLKAAGISENVINAILTFGSKGPVVADSQVTGVDVRILYKEGKYGEAVDHINADLQEHPNNAKDRTLLIMVYLKLGRKELAMKELEKLKAQPPTDETKLYIAKVNELLTSLSAKEEIKAKLTSALQNYNATKAEELINQLPASKFQKQILILYLRLYQGKYDDARKVVSSAEVSSFSDQQKVEAIQAQIATAETSFNQLTRRIETYQHSPLVPSVCFHAQTWPGNPDMLHTTFSDFNSISLDEYLSLIKKFSQLAPLNETVLDTVFHGEIIVGKYEDLEEVGDRILKAKGSIKIPFYSKDRYFDVVIDQINQRLFTEPDSHPFTVRYTAHGGSLKFDENANPWNAELVPFDLTFDQITAIHQKAHYRGVPDLLERNSYALKFEPTGVAPNYALMHYLHCLAGADAQETATRNLGKFVVHVIGGPNIKQDLVTPDKAHTFGDTLTMGLLAVYGGMATARGDTQAVQLSSEASQLLATDAANKQAVLSEQQAAWYSMMTTQAFAFLEGTDFAGLEKLVGAL
jgi:tetratricopeptide (TPR) repeat protein